MSSPSPVTNSSEDQREYHPCEVRQRGEPARGREVEPERGGDELGRRRHAEVQAPVAAVVEDQHRQEGERGEDALEGWHDLGMKKGGGE